MKLEKIEIVKAFLASWLDYWILQAIAATVLVLQADAAYSLWCWVLLSFYPFALYLLRRKFPGFVGFLVSHLGIAALFLVLPMTSTMERVFFTIYVAGYAIYSLYIRMNTAKWQDRAMPPLMAGVVLIVLSIIIYYFRRSELENWLMFLCVGYLVLYFTYSYMLEYIHFVKMNEDSAGYIPVRKMFKAGLKNVLPYSLLSGVLLLVIGNMSWLTKLFNLISYFFKWLLRLLFSSIDSNGDFQQTQDENPFTQMAGDMEKLEGETFWVWELVEKVMIVAIIVLGLIIVVKVYKFVSGFLKNAFAKPLQKANEVKEELIDVREKCTVEKERNSQNKKHVLSMFSGKDRIRKIYKKKIEGARKTSGFRNFLKENKTEDVCTKDSSTARECCETLSAQPLALVYEKARYSNMDCNSEDVKIAKKWQ